eukprot:9485974-Pyramimonas_sp.AAC.1
MVAENIRTIEDQIQGITAGLGKLIEAHGTLKYQPELPLIWPSVEWFGVALLGSSLQAQSEKGCQKVKKESP